MQRPMLEATDHSRADVLGETESQAEQAYRVLRAAISNLELQPDELLSEAMLAQRYGFGRTPVREAVHRLRQDGLVVSIPRRGLVVSSFTGEDVRELYEMLEALDGMAAYLATERADADGINRLRDLNEQGIAALARQDYRAWQEYNFAFHQLLVDLSGNKRMQQAFTLLHDQLKRALLLTLPIRQNQAQSMAEHREMLEAMARRAPECARAIAQQHRRRVRQEVLEALSRIPLPRMQY
jgi:DNA-binding GntR family transcriptional regulator